MKTRMKTTRTGPNERFVVDWIGGDPRELVRRRRRKFALGVAAAIVFGVARADGPPPKRVDRLGAPVSGWPAGSGAAEYIGAPGTGGAAASGPVDEADLGVSVGEDSLGVWGRYGMTRHGGLGLRIAFDDGRAEEAAPQGSAVSRHHRPGHCRRGHSECSPSPAPPAVAPARPVGAAAAGDRWQLDVHWWVPLGRRVLGFAGPGIGRTEGASNELTGSLGLAVRLPADSRLGVYWSDGGGDDEIGAMVGWRIW